MPKRIKQKATKGEIAHVMRTLGARGGKIGGKRRLETMTAEERRAVARRGAAARWARARDARAEGHKR